MQAQDITATPFALSGLNPAARSGNPERSPPSPKPISGGKQQHCLSWVLAPGWKNFGFAIRTASAAIVSLLIAMWMELDSPQWAPLTVWVVAVSSRGESLSKARWRIVGTLVGSVVAVALIAAFPQQEMLLFCALGLWIGLCCGLGSLLGNYRAYGLVLTGFTSAIVATAAITDPEHVFEIAIARSSYIMLGVVCEAAFAMLLAPSLPETARAALRRRLHAAFRKTEEATRALVAGQGGGARLHAALDELVTFSAQIEFSENEMEPASHSGDHARAALAAMLTMLSRAQAFSFMPVAGGAVAAPFPAALADLLADPAIFAADRERIRVMQAPRPAKSQGATGQDVPEQGAADHIAHALLVATDTALAEIAAADHPKRGDLFRYRHVSARNVLDALGNGLRACCTVLAAWLVWEITAWPSGTSFISYAVLVHGLLATRENPKRSSIPFLTGGFYCCVVAALMSFLVIPMVTSPEALALVLLVPMTLGGLAARDSRTAGYAFPFNMFLPVLIGPMNLGRDDEISFLNNALAFLMAIMLVVLAYHLITRLAFTSDMARVEAWLRQRLRRLGRPDSTITEPQWLSACSARLVRILRNPEDVPEDRLATYMQVQLAAMTAGAELIHLREIAARSGLSPELRRMIRLFLHRWQQGHVEIESRLPLFSAGLRRWGAMQRAEEQTIAAHEIFVAFNVICRAGNVGKQPL